MSITPNNNTGISKNALKYLLKVRKIYWNIVYYIFLLQNMI